MAPRIQSTELKGYNTTDRRTKKMKHFASALNKSADFLTMWHAKRPPLCNLEEQRKGT